MAISVHPSPRWNDKKLQYPNIQQASDYITCQIWREEVSEHLNYLKKYVDTNLVFVTLVELMNQ